MANINFNKTILGGRITKDIELKTTSNGRQFVNFSLAINRQGKSGDQTADFFPVTVWGDKAKFVFDYFHKGSSIIVVGSLKNDRYTDKEGVERTITAVNAYEAYFVDSKGESEQAEKKEKEKEKFEFEPTPFYNEDDLPF